MRSFSSSESSRQTISPAHAPLNVSKRRKMTPRLPLATLHLPALLHHTQSRRTCVRSKSRCVSYLWYMCEALSNMPHIKAIQYLSADYQPTRVQTAQGIQRLTKNLAAFDLTKAEKLQIVNLTPVEPVELYVVRSSLSSLSSLIHAPFFSPM